jgi:hypothetical protein
MRQGAGSISHFLQLLQVPLEVYLPKHGFGLLQVLLGGDAVEFPVFTVRLKQAFANIHVRSREVRR